jgi:pyridoxamine 5'-phosphate oxidase
LEDLRNYINNIRRDFSSKQLDESSVGNNPYQLFAQWFEEAVGSQILDPYAMMIATVSKENKPSSRVVYMRDISEKGLVFYTNYDSQKGNDLDSNPHISLLFFWGELERQIRIEGKVSVLDPIKSDSYFSSRPRESQIGAWTSNQSQIIESRKYLEDRYKEFTAKFENKNVDRPKQWGGYLVEPTSFEFWQGRPSRLHDRVKFLHSGSDWKIVRLAP